MLLISLSVAWVVGIWLGSSFSLPWPVVLSGFIPLLPLFFVRRHRRRLVLASLVLFAFLGAAVSAYPRLHPSDEGTLRLYNDRGTFEIKGTVAGDPDVRDTGTRLRLEAAAIEVGGDWQEIKGTALVFTPNYPAYRYGDVLLVTGKPATPDDTGDFDYRGYLAHQGIYTTIFYPGIEVRETGRGSPVLAGVYALRGRLAESLGRVLPEPPAALAKGMVLGIRGSIPQSLDDAFARSGTTHILAISGVNLSIMAGIMLGIGIAFFGRRYYLYVWLGLAVIWCYALITGMQAPVVRGAVMASLFLLAELFGRQRRAVVALPFAAAVMVGFSPGILGDAAFQLSFLSMAGLVWLSPLIQRPGERVVAAWLGEEGIFVSLAGAVVATLSATLGAVIAVWPVVAYHFGMVSLVSPLATLLALPALTGIIVAGTLAAFLGLVFLPLAQVFGWAAWLFLSYLMLVVNGLAAPSLASVEGTVGTAFIVVYYLALALALVLYRYRQKWLGPVAETVARLGSGMKSLDVSRSWKWVLLPLAIAAVLACGTAATMPDGKLRVSFLDVGQGDAILIQKGTRQVLIDGGPGPQALELALGRAMPFWDRNIDLVVLTHPHQDHLAGLVAVLRDYDVGQVLCADEDYDSPVYDEWWSLLAEKDIRRTAAMAGQRIDLGDGVILQVLGPEAPLTGTDSDVDNNSLVLRLSRGRVSFLLAADTMKEAEWALLEERAAPASTVLKVAHHGSDTSTTLEFLAAVGPRAAVISVGADNRFGLPDDEVVARLQESLGPENIYRTDENGTVEFTTDGERLWVKKER